ncbi:MAG: ABC transporter permease [candidate division Zixibacteria bacterium]|nr:ABC transporter permease [candidate division Zixibacteria bacterium]
MKPSILFNVFAQDFKKQRKRMVLTLMAILWGTMSIMLLLAYGEGMKDQFSKNLNGLGEGIVILWGGQTSVPFQGYGKGRRIHLHPEDVDYLKGRMPELEIVAAEYIRWGAEIKYKDKLISERINGVYPEYKEIRNFIPEMGGRMINELDMQSRRRVAFLGNEVKNRLFGYDTPDENIIGETIQINSTPYTVIGIMQPKIQMSSYQGSDEDVIAIPATTFHAILGDPYLDNIIFKPAEGFTFEDIESRLFSVMGSKYKFDPNDDQTLHTWDIMEERKVTMDIFQVIQYFLGFVGGLTLIIAAVGVANIMYVSIKERTREIGIKMAIGARRIYILMQFIVEALGITFLGGTLGICSAYLLTELFKMVPIESEVLNFMGRPTVSLEIGITVTVILGILGFFAGLFPAMKAASVNPNEALRYE